MSGAKVILYKQLLLVANFGKQPLKNKTKMHIIPSHYAPFEVSL